jgi:uncharacterized protein with von Willebrand factor type A (vWA) domain
MIGESVFAGNDYEHVSLCYFDSGINTKTAYSLNVYQDFVKRQNANGSTNFIACFDYIRNFTQSNPIKDLAVIFFTDGQDTMNNMSTVLKSLDALSAFLV